MEEITIVNKILDMVLSLAPVLLTGVITFFITRYTYNKNVPLDKIEIAYNKIYYPIYKLIRSEFYTNIDQQELQEKMNFILLKYDKYISQSTRSVYYTYLNQYNSRKKTDIALRNFYNNIISYNVKYRFLLGYPQPNKIELYKYLDSKTKKIIIITMCILLIWLIEIIYQTFKYKWLMFLITLFIAVVIYVIAGIIIDLLFDFFISIFKKN